MRELSELSGLHKTTITNVELGKTTMIPAYVVHAFALALGVQTSYLMEKAGYGDEGGRMANFSRRDQRILMVALARTSSSSTTPTRTPPPRPSTSWRS
jgi:transcriptional regulator with XRE-family HTH domain